MTTRSKHPLLGLPDERARELFPFAWAMQDLRDILAQGYRTESALQIAEFNWRDTGDPTRLRDVLQGIQTRAQAVLDSLDEPVTEDGRRLKIGLDFFTLSPLHRFLGALLAAYCVAAAFGKERSS